MRVWEFLRYLDEYYEDPDLTFHIRLEEGGVGGRSVVYVKEREDV